jgi:hypothetical protein
MKLKILALSSASALVIALGSAMADPQAGNPYTQNPTPQERAQTNDLNKQSSDTAVQQTSDVQAQQDAVDQQSSQNAQAYDHQMQQYQDGQDRAQAQQDQYEADRAEYYDRTHPTAWWHDRYERASLDRLYGVHGGELAGLTVSKEDGYRIGRVASVDRGPGGRIVRVEVVMPDNRSSWVDARDLRYDPDDQIVFTDLTAREVHDRSF